MAINERVNITVTSNGTVRVKRELDDVGNSARSAAKGVDLLQGAFTGWLTGNALSALVRYADTFTNINNRLKIVSKSTDELTKSQEALYNIAQDTYQSFESTATIFARTRTATEKLGYSTEQAMKFTKQLSQSVALSGVSAQSANQALVQLSQGLASGTLRGEELNSLLEQLPYAAQTLAQGLGITVGKLRELGAAGVLTPKQIIDAFNKMSASIENDFQKMTPTISQALQVLENGFVRLLGLLETNSGVFGLVASGIALIGRNMEIVAIAVTPVIAALTILAVQVLGTMLWSALTAATAATISFVSALGAMAVTTAVAVVGALISATTAVWGFTAALLANPITWAVAALVGLGVILLKLTGYFDTVKEHVIEWATALLDYINKVIAAVKKLLGMTDKAATGTKQAMGGFGGGAGTGAGALDKANDNLAKTLSKGGDSYAEKVKKANDAANEAGADMLAKSYGKGGGDAANQIEDAGKKAGNSMADAIETAGRNVATSISSVSIGGKSSGNSGRISMDQFAKAKTVGLTSSNSNVPTNGRASASDPSSPYTPGFANGGSMRVGGSGGTDSQMVQFKATPNEHVTVETPAQRRANNSNSPVVVPAPQVQIVNQIDPRGSIDAMQTRAGRTATRNNIKADAEQIRRILGL